jgi:small GTP-binding protein
LTEIDLILKFILLGFDGVGKTSLRRRYLGLGFREEYLKTIGVDLSYLEYQYQSTKATIVLWDIAGEEEFRKGRSLYYSGSNAGIYVLDLTQEFNLEKSMWWIDDFVNKQDNLDKIPFNLVLLGNKVDLKDERQIKDEQIQELKDEITKVWPGNVSLKYLETSALTGEKVNEAFEWVIENTIKIIEEIGY